MDDLDLDIHNYTIRDIEKFFRFKHNSKYTASDIEQKEYEIREQLLNSGHVNKRFKRDLIEFLSLAKDWLIFVKCPPNKNPTTIPKNYKLDPIDVPHLNEIPSRSDELVKKPETQYINVQNSDFFPGIMNPLSTRIITKCLNIDTRFRENIYKTQCSDFMIQLPTKFNKVVSMQLSSIEFPVSFYGISEAFGNNFLYMKVNYNSFDVSGQVLDEEKIIVLPDGNYNSTDFIDKINSLLAPLNPDNTYVYPTSIFSHIQFSIDINPNGSGSGKVIVEPTCDFCCYVNSITLDFTRDIHGKVDNIPISSKIGWNLGFIKPFYTNQTKYISDTIIEPASIRYFYLAVDDFNNNVNNHFISVFNKSILSPNILARISIKGSYFSIIMESDFNIVSEPRKYFGPVDIQKLHVQLFDEHGRILHMNHSNFSFCLNLKMLYDL